MSRLMTHAALRGCFYSRRSAVGLSWPRSAWRCPERSWLPRRELGRPLRAGEWFGLRASVKVESPHSWGGTTDPPWALLWTSTISTGESGSARTPRTSAAISGRASFVAISSGSAGRLEHRSGRASARHWEVPRSESGPGVKTLRSSGSSLRTCNGREFRQTSLQGRLPSPRRWVASLQSLVVSDAWPP